MSNFSSWFRYAVPIIVSLVAIVQFYHAQHGLTRWKGGGYGMYTELNFPHRQAWIVLPDTSMNLAQIPKFAKRNRRFINKFMRYPNAQNRQVLTEKLAKIYPDSFQIQLWVPSVNTENLSLCKELIH